MVACWMTPFSWQERESSGAFRSGCWRGSEGAATPPFPPAPQRQGGEQAACEGLRRVQPLWQGWVKGEERESCGHCVLKHIKPIATENELHHRFLRGQIVKQMLTFSYQSQFCFRKKLNLPEEFRSNCKMLFSLLNQTGSSNLALFQHQSYKIFKMLLTTLSSDQMGKSSFERDVWKLMEFLTVKERTKQNHLPNAESHKLQFIGFLDAFA